MWLACRLATLLVWINNDTEYEMNIEAFSKTYKEMVHQLPFFIWRDASVQHFQVRFLQDQLAENRQVTTCIIVGCHQLCCCTKASSHKIFPELRGGIMHCKWHLIRHIHCQGQSCLLCRAAAFGGKTRVGSDTCCHSADAHRRLQQCRLPLPLPAHWR